MRDYCETLGWDKASPGPELTEEVVGHRVEVRPVAEQRPDPVVVGEGRLDEQTLQGKVAGEIASLEKIIVFQKDAFEAMLRGVMEDCPIVGGDTASWDGPLVLTVTILGRSAGITPAPSVGRGAGRHNADGEGRDEH